MLRSPLDLGKSTCMFSLLFPLIPSLYHIWFHFYPVLCSMPIFPSQSFQPASLKVESPGLHCWRERLKVIGSSEAWGCNYTRGYWSDFSQREKVDGKKPGNLGFLSWRELHLFRPGAGMQRNSVMSSRWPNRPLMGPCKTPVY